jgi:hypothetical protein
MNESEPNFESLRRALVLKRHETPPPGYFNNFSRQVMARIRAGEAQPSASLSDQVLGSMPWFIRLLQSLETKPVFAGGFATALCGLLLFGAVMARQPDYAAQTILQPPQQSGASLIAAAEPPTLSQPVNQFFVADNSTNPVANFPSPGMGSMPVNGQLITFPASGN